MWTCVTCDEAENEESFKFCFSCGAPGPTADEHTRDERLSRPEAAPAPPSKPWEEPPAPETHDHGFKLPKALTSLGQRLRHATASAGDQVISVRVSQEAEEAVELLLQAGRYDNHADAAGFLLEEGVKAQAELLWVIREKLSEIERLRAELRGIGGGR
jgi:Arc/MetJ-type ribon-helix-helix transcriptional regulator